MSSRSVTITLVNTTNLTLMLTSTSLSHGTWQTAPPATIGKKATWEAVSDGFATGVQGFVVYQIGSSATQAQGTAPAPNAPPTPAVTLNFDNPYVGSDDFSAAPSAGFNCAVTSNAGNDAQVTYTLSAA